MINDHIFQNRDAGRHCAYTESSVSIDQKPVPVRRDIDQKPIPARRDIDQ